MSPNITPNHRRTGYIVLVVCTSKGGPPRGFWGVLDESAPLTGPARPLGLSKFVSCHQCFFFVVGIASTFRNRCKFSLHNFCWAGNAYFSTQTVFTNTFFPPKKKTTISLTLTRTLKPKTPMDPLILVLHVIIGLPYLL